MVVSISAVLVGTLLVPLDSTVNVDFPWITAHYRLSIPQIQWLVISYTLSTASLMLLTGRAADMLGYRRVFLAGCIWSAGAFTLCAIAPAYGWLLAARAMQGIGAGLILSSGPALITSFFTDAERPRGLGIYAAALGLGGAIGPPVGAMLIARFGWSAVFWFRAPMSCMGFLLGLALPHAAAPAARERFDLPGAVLLMVAISAALLALNQVRHAAVCASMLIVTVLASWGFVQQERHVPHPIIDVALFRDPGFTTANIASVLINLAGFAILLLLPFQLAGVPGLPVAAAGLLLAASPAGFVLAAPLAGRIARHMSAGRLMMMGSVLASAGLLGVARFAENLPPLAAAALIQGAGQGMFQVAYLDLVTSSIQLRDRGVAGALAMLTRTLGLVSGATLLMLVFQAAEAAATGHRAATPAAFLTGFRVALCSAAVIAAVSAAAGLFRSPGRERST